MTGLNPIFDNALFKVFLQNQLQKLCCQIGKYFQTYFVKINQCIEKKKLSTWSTWSSNSKESFLRLTWSILYFERVNTQSTYYSTIFKSTNQIKVQRWLLLLKQQSDSLSDAKFYSKLVSKSLKSSLSLNNENRILISSEDSLKTSILMKKSCKNEIKFNPVVNSCKI